MELIIRDLTEYALEFFPGIIIVVFMLIELLYQHKNKREIIQNIVVNGIQATLCVFVLILWFKHITFLYYYFLCLQVILFMFLLIIYWTRKKRERYNSIRIPLFQLLIVLLSVSWFLYLDYTINP